MVFSEDREIITKVVTKYDGIPNLVKVTEWKDYETLVVLDYRFDNEELGLEGVRFCTFRRSR